MTVQSRSSVGSCANTEAVLYLHWLKWICPTGQQLFLCCEAFTNCMADQTLIYWLVDGAFPEDTPSSGRIVEMEE